MKKLIVIMITLLSVTVINAATFNWTAVKLTGPSASDLNGATFDITKAVANLYSSAISDSVIDTTAISYNSSVNKKNNFSGLTTDIKKYKNGNDIKTGESIDFYFTIVGTDSAGNEWTYTANSVSSSVEEFGNTGVLFKTPTGTWVMTKAAGGGEGGSEGVPEPTSGLLLLVGGALMALRRKQK